jgi:hypothetical protein
MLQSVQQEREVLKARDETLKQREATLRAWLKEERPQIQGDLPINGRGSELSELLLGLLSPGLRLTAGALGIAAHDRGLIADGVKPGRAVHGSLMGLKKHGRVKRNADGTWSRQ